MMAAWLWARQHGGVILAGILARCAVVTVFQSPQGPLDGSRFVRGRSSMSGSREYRSSFCRLYLHMKTTRIGARIPGLDSDLALVSQS